jgi:hypothetical protein
MDEGPAAEGRGEVEDDAALATTALGDAVAAPAGPGDPHTSQ